MLVNLEHEAVQARQRQRSAEHALAAAQQRIQPFSSGDGTPSTPAGVIDTRFLGKPKSPTGQTTEWTTSLFTFKAFACAAHPRKKEVFDLARRKGSDPVVNSDMTAEMQSLSTQLNNMLVMMLSQALEIVRNSLEGIGAEVWRKLLWECEPGVGIRYGAMLLSPLKRRFGEHDETDLSVTTPSTSSSPVISDAIKHGTVSGHMALQGLKKHRSECQSVGHVQGTA